MKNLYKWLGIYLFVVAGLLTANNLFFASSPDAAFPLFIYIDVLVIIGFMIILGNGFYKIYSSNKSEVYQLLIGIFGITGHLYAYNTLAKVSSSGLVSPTLWLIIDPVVMALFIYRGLQWQKEEYE